jgi:regulation of enolase protein 1 (concanavalin A-like superfamily)
MINRLERILGVALLLSVSISAHAGTFNDSFDTPRDYLTEGVVNTGWDGFIGRGPGETVSILNASQDRPGELHMASAGGNWPGATLGPFLYKVVAGDFVATVRVASYTTMAYNYCGLMARVANLDDAGSGEDWVSIDYFPQYTVGNIAHSCNDGTRQETVGGANRATPHAYLQLERVGNAFYLRTSTDGVTWVDYPSAMYSPMTRDDMAGLPVQVGIWQATFTGGEGDVAFDDFTLSGAGIIVGNRAYNARPVGSATEVSRDTVLSWTPAEGATAHDVYFGTDEAAVTAADATSPLCVSKAQEPNTYDPDRLEFGQTYYWRIDEIGADGQIIDGGQGAVLSFTVEPFSYPITGIIATASGSNKAAQGPERTVDGSGLNDNDEHSTIAEDGWVSAKGDPQWIQYELPEVCKLDKMLVWNSNQAMESLFGFGAKDVTIEASLDGTEWTTVGTFEFAQAPGESTYAANTTVDLGGATARYVKLTIHSNWGGLFQQYGLSEVRFFSIPVTAREPEPAPGTTGLHPQVALSWRAGREAGSHELYIGADPNAVADGAVAPVTTTLPQYDVAANLGETWYWKVTEVNEAQTPTSWDSPVWSFSTSTYIVVDDFET